VLNVWVFTDPLHVREEAQRWMVDYNTMRPHDSLRDLSPCELLTRRGHADFFDLAVD
jgi:transposase InsO family protein